MKAHSWCSFGSLQFPPASRSEEAVALFERCSAIQTMLPFGEEYDPRQRHLANSRKRFAPSFVARPCISAIPRSPPASRRLRERWRGQLMQSLSSDAFVFFGATGDLAYKKVFRLCIDERRGRLASLIASRGRRGLHARDRARSSLESMAFASTRRRCPAR